MTHNQIDYGRLQEEKRHNLASEGETFRHNVTTETETSRHNISVEQETSRHNVADETETRRHNIVNEIEVNRHNVVNESEVNRHNLATEYETSRYNTEVIRHNQASEALQASSIAVERSKVAVQERANEINAQHYSRVDRQNANRIASEITLNNARISNLTAQNRNLEASSAYTDTQRQAYTGDLFQGFTGRGVNNTSGLAYAQLQSTMAQANLSQTRADIAPYETVLNAGTNTLSSLVRLGS